ncbi:SMI1/KNR4 family protein [Methylobacterium haplocladii]|uniref:Knr4/Smi1-like domain-containing protein n=1 Tax=Methylobacterium haplocladii TaxID=1176176 RepID=A0A512IN39_9HYPH|nr:SMI1/KNR4 family protein [Methylobacterium haplocladii]GEO99120.1 hypothetical protein MHA02_15080 [Methylobacterium haplocladii]GJD84781.1 hypothetical protein HPGCJGGD_2664 [Methylobacterium haplocladii]GLS58363.1 hypothetical protein GCM10007887_10230 [Methylobacterium haplocladii]
MPVANWRSGRPVDPKRLAAFETSRGIIFPPAYKAIVALHDGACPEPDNVAFRDDRFSTGYDVIGIGQLYPFGENEDGGWTIDEANDQYRAVFPGLVFISECANGWSFALDYAPGKDEPPVVLVRFGIHDQGSVVEVAQSFEKLLAGVLEDDCRPATMPNLV